MPPITKIKNATVVGSQRGMRWLVGVKTVEGAQLIAQDDIVFTASLDVDEDVFEVPSVLRIGSGATEPSEGLHDRVILTGTLRLSFLPGTTRKPGKYSPS